MRDRWLIVTGLTLILVAAVGMSLTGPAGAWGRHHGMMGWWEPDLEDAAPPVEGASTLVVEATEFAFEPSEVVVDAGDPFNLSLVNRGALVHDLVLPDLDVHLTARPGESVTAGVEAVEAGTYRFICTLPGHAEAGMVGELLVAEGT